MLYEFAASAPTVPGGLRLNHWSNGDPGWSAGPPAQDAHMEVSYVKAYFNTTNSDVDYKLRCHDPSDPGAICQIPDQLSPPNPSQTTTFWSPNKGLPEQDSPAQKGLAPVNPAPSSSATANPAAAPSNPAPAPQKPPPASSKKVTPDATCGGDKGYTCIGGEHGDCCSSHGWWYVAPVSKAHYSEQFQPSYEEFSD